MNDFRPRPDGARQVPILVGQKPSHTAASLAVMPRDVDANELLALISETVRAVVRDELTTAFAAVMERRSQ